MMRSHPRLALSPCAQCSQSHETRSAWLPHTHLRHSDHFNDTTRMHSTRPERIRSHSTRSAEQHTHIALLSLACPSVCCLPGLLRLLLPSSHAPTLSPACIPLTHNVWRSCTHPADSYLLASLIRRCAAAFPRRIPSRWRRSHSFPAHQSLRTEPIRTQNTGREQRYSRYSSPKAPPNETHFFQRHGSSFFLHQTLTRCSSNYQRMIRNM
jgi:hypothetical protein